jgi:amino acid permease
MTIGSSSLMDIGQATKESAMLQGRRNNHKQAKDTGLRGKASEPPRRPDIVTRSVVVAFNDRRRDTDKCQVDAEKQREAAVHRRSRRIAVGIAFIVAGIAIAVVMPLAVMQGRWAVASTVVVGVAVSLFGTRVVAGRDWGGEIVTWGSLLVAVAAIVVAIASSSH